MEENEVCLPECPPINIYEAVKCQNLHLTIKCVQAGQAGWWGGERGDNDKQQPGVDQHHQGHDGGRGGKRGDRPNGAVQQVQEGSVHLQEEVLLPEVCEGGTPQGGRHCCQLQQV